MAAAVASGESRSCWNRTNSEQTHADEPSAAAPAAAAAADLVAACDLDLSAAPAPTTLASFALALETTFFTLALAPASLVVGFR